MAIGTDLEQLLRMLRAATGKSMRVNVGVDDAEAWKLLLSDEQELIYAEHPWRHLVQVVTKPIHAGSRFYDAPEELALDRIIDVSTTYQGEIFDVVKGIGVAQYAQHREGTREREDPVRRWDVRWQGTGPVIEVWPVPATNGALLISGMTALKPLIAETDRCMVDDTLIVRRVAAGILARQGSKDASLVAETAAARKAKLIANEASDDVPVRFGLTPAALARRPHGPRRPE